MGQTETESSGLLGPLCTAYADLMRRQRTSASAFVRWSAATRRAHEFTWLFSEREKLMLTGEPLAVSASDKAFDSIHKMMTTLELNPYERDAHYGYPYVVGMLGDKPVRAPLFTVVVEIESTGRGLTVAPKEDVLRFNSLAFRSDFDPAATEKALARMIAETPSFPLDEDSLRDFCARLGVELKDLKLRVDERLSGRLETPPAQPRSGDNLRIVDNAAVFVAPKTSYFVVSDLERIGAEGRLDDETALATLLGQKADKPTSDVFDDDRSVVYPFLSNKSQRHVARLIDDDSNQLVVVQGPPGTGKSLTIANLVCHLVARGKRVLVTSQRDKALEVVDELLRGLNLAQLPMTLLKNDKESKQELRSRLDSIQKHKPAAETEDLKQRQEAKFGEAVASLKTTDERLADCLLCESFFAKEEARLHQEARTLRRMAARTGSSWRRFRAGRRAPWMSDSVGKEANRQRQQLLSESVEILTSSSEDRVSRASRNQRNQLREFSRLLSRNQTTYKNFSIFDRLKEEPDRCDMLLSILPCWIMTPDDVARLFPCKPGVFDVVIIDEASQCDLPSITPVLYRARQAVVAGDSRQMQARRFAFTNEQVARQAWQQQGLEAHDPDRWLDPTKMDLLQLADIRADDHALLDEHFRSLPPIIQFSNDRWYNGQLRIMRDLGHRRFGDQERPVISMNRVRGGSVEEGTQENLKEAKDLVVQLHKHMQDPGFAGATFGVICLFEEQMRLVMDLVAEQIPEELRADHRLTVVNPDGFQGDERDVIYYSLSYDAKGMTKSQIAARQADQDHIQGMLNVAFTRARDEIHIFHSASLKDFAKASGQGTIRDWLEFCSAKGTSLARDDARQVARADSEFEAQVIMALSDRGVTVTAQYPSCGYFIDVVVELDGRRLAVECDGELFHLDEHGELRREDLERQEVLERAGWRVTRIPDRGGRRTRQRKWRGFCANWDRRRRFRESSTTPDRSRPGHRSSRRSKPPWSSLYRMATTPRVTFFERRESNLATSDSVRQ